MEKLAKNGRQATFMLVVYFIKKQNGQMYSLEEIQGKENRKQFDSYDWYYTKNDHRIRNEQIGLTKLMNFKTKMSGNYYGGYIIAVKADKKILTWGRDGIIKHQAFPEFHTNKESQEVILMGVENTQIHVPVKKEVMPLYNNINSPEKQKYYSTAYQNKLSDLVKHLSTK